MLYSDIEVRAIHEARRQQLARDYHRGKAMEEYVIGIIRQFVNQISSAVAMWVQGLRVEAWKTPSSLLES